MAKKPRVVVPVNPKELLELSQDVYLHHQALGNASPLLAMEAPNWNDGPNGIAGHGFGQTCQRIGERVEKHLPETRFAAWCD